MTTASGTGHPADPGTGLATAAGPRLPGRLTTRDAARRQARAIRPAYVKTALIVSAIALVLQVAYCLWSVPDLLAPAPEDDRASTVAYLGIVWHVAWTAASYLGFVLFAVAGWREARTLAGFAALGSSRQAFLAGRARVLAQIGAVYAVVIAAGFQVDRLAAGRYEFGEYSPLNHIYRSPFNLIPVAIDTLLLAITFAATGFLLATAAIRLTGAGRVAGIVTALIPLAGMQLAGKMRAATAAVQVPWAMLGYGPEPAGILVRPPAWLTGFAQSTWGGATAGAAWLALTALACWLCAIATWRLPIEPARP